jgi:hypothetical protein
MTGELYAVATFDSNGQVEDMEFLDKPPLWFLDPLNQKCFMGNVNGGDSIQYDNMVDLIALTVELGQSIETWIDAHGNTATSKYVPPKATGRHAAKPYAERLRDKGFLA